LDNKRILVVEDDQDAASYLTALFQDNGYDALAAETGEEGVQIARGQSPDLITLDISMPEKPGLRALRELQEDAATSAIPVIIVKGLSTDTEELLGQVRSLLT
jgi:twitching motility two-component system response regulator PilH